MFAARTELSVAIAKRMAEALNVDLFDEYRRGNFRQIVQNCVSCAHNSQCARNLTDMKPLATPLPHCRNNEIFSLGN